MTMPFTHRRTHYTLLLPALALTLAACGDDIQGTTEGSSGTAEGTTEIDPTKPPTTVDPTTGDPPTTTIEPTTIEPTSTSSTTDPTASTTEPVTSGPSTGDTTANTTSGDTTSGTGTSTGDTTGDTTGDSTTGGVVVGLPGVWATQNPAGLATDALVRYPFDLSAPEVTLLVEGEVVSIQSIGVNSSGDAFISFDAPGGVGGVIFRDNLAINPMNGQLGMGDRVIVGPATGLIAPKGVEAAGPTGTFIVADTGAADFKVFDFDDNGDVAPLFTIADLGSSAAVWDVHYVANADTLYAAGTNGEVQVYEDFKDAMGQAGPDRTIVPADAGVKISVNLHGIAVDSNVLYLSDVGDAMNTTDGQLFVIESANTASALKQVKQRIQGGQLGNPVDIELRPGLLTNLYVAEKANDAVIVYTRNLMTGVFELGKNLAVTKPESVAVVAASNLIVSSNPAGFDADMALALAAPMVDINPLAVFDKLGTVNSIQSLVIAPSGDGHVSFDGPAFSGGGGAFTIDALSATAADGSTSAVASRLWGVNPKIIAPKALHLADADRLFVADFGAVDIKLFDSTLLGDDAPLASFLEIGGVPAWDVDYDDASDRLYVASTDGKLRVFDDALLNLGVGGPTRTINPTDDQNAPIGVNLHGIHYDAGSNTVIVSDVGSAQNATDGAIFVIAGADAADGDVVVQAVIRGDQTKLGNPVDIAFDGANLYVAEKANSLVQRYDGVLALVGEQNIPASAEIASANPESVQIVAAP
jgi:hypothetical protein